MPSELGLPHVFIDDIENPVLGENDDHHFRKVLRIKDGDSITVADGLGNWRCCVYGKSIEATGEIIRVEEAKVKISIGFSLIKSGRPELVVQKLTELGVDCIVPVAAQRSVVQWNEKKSKDNVSRLNRIAREASMQSRRVYLPKIEPLIGALEIRKSRKVSMAHPGGNELSVDNNFLLIGPEGGWSEEEIEGADICSLGTGILRSETAAIASAAILVALRDGRVRPSKV